MMQYAPGSTTRKNGRNGKLNQEVDKINDRRQSVIRKDWLDEVYLQRVEGIERFNKVTKRNGQERNTTDSDGL